MESAWNVFIEIRVALQLRLTHIAERGKNTPALTQAEHLTDKYRLECMEFIQTLINKENEASPIGTSSSSKE